MIVKPKFLKFLFGILAISLMVPFSPSVSLAKAKMCCKKKCLSMMVTVPSSASKPVKHCSHQKDPRQCCENNCSKVITYNKPEPFSFIGARTEIETPDVYNYFSIILQNSSTQRPDFFSQNKASSFLYKLPSPRLYLSNSILLI
jgi:hypothetical protein